MLFADVVIPTWLLLTVGGILLAVGGALVAEVWKSYEISSFSQVLGIFILLGGVVLMSLGLAASPFF